MNEAKNLYLFGGRRRWASPALGDVLAFEDPAFAEGAISPKHKQLIAVAVALTSRCPHCMHEHFRTARRAGATERELEEATLSRPHSAPAVP